MKTLIRKFSKFQALQYTGENRDEIMKFLGITNKENCSQWRNDDTKACYLMILDPLITLGKIEAKDWVLLGNGSVQCCSPLKLRENYEEI